MPRPTWFCAEGGAWPVTSAGAAQPASQRPERGRATAVEPGPRFAPRARARLVWDRPAPSTEGDSHVRTSRASARGRSPDDGVRARVQRRGLAVHFGRTVKRVTAASRTPGPHAVRTAPRSGSRQGRGRGGRGSVCFLLSVQPRPGNLIHFQNLGFGSGGPCSEKRQAQEAFGGVCRPAGSVGVGRGPEWGPSALRPCVSGWPSRILYIGIKVSIKYHKGKDAKLSLTSRPCGS